MAFFHYKLQEVHGIEDMQAVEREERIGQGLTDVSVKGLASQTQMDDRYKMTTHEAN